ncbi:hypothetical protein BDV41DRAFT_3950 [Aspergillus transmontanensis]|uniref:Uncharacterized protein n=1 Tax=Aspergillus transmontanensis TaxID=1034304 RepID=A0A5N6WH98_9EURO|nr:hypothetical protein BDV41DRAFT_3950 [Aspergillus transmontanensis]
MEVCISRTMVARWGVIVTDLVGRVVIWTVEVEISAILYGIFGFVYLGWFGLRETGSIRALSRFLADLQPRGASF